jgi:hypothetical protein
MINKYDKYFKKRLKLMTDNCHSISRFSGPVTDHFIVGLKFHPPALALVRALPLNCPLILRPEPDNAYDPNAIQVILPTSTIPPSAFGQINEELQSSGMEIDELLAQSEWLLGYIPKEKAAEIRLLPGDTPAEFAFHFSGKPLVRFEDKT